MSDLQELRVAGIQWYRAWIREYKGVETPRFNGVEKPDLTEWIGRYNEIEQKLQDYDDE